MYRVCGLWLATNFGARLAADKNFYLRLAVEKKSAFVVSTNTYLRPCGCSGTNVTAAVDSKYPKTKIKSEIIKIQIIEIQI